MEKHVTIQDDEFAVTAREEKSRRHGVMAICPGKQLNRPKACYDVSPYRFLTA